MVRRRIFFPGSGFAAHHRHNLRQAPRLQAGLTLVEILVSLSITIILAGLAMGSHSIYSNFSTVSEVNSFISDLYFSRSEALKRHTTVTICRSSDGKHCSKGPDWQTGWIIFSDKNRNREIDDEDQLLQIRDALSQPVSLTLGSGFYYYIMFSDTGEAYPRNTFKFCRAGHLPRGIILFATGRARISQRDSSGKPLKC